VKPFSFEAEDLSEFTVERFAVMFTPRQAASVNAMVAALRLCVEPDPEMDALMENDPGHRMFMYCLNAVARRA
jgi:hypothetical protein